MIGDREISITDKDIIEGSPIMMILQTLPSGKHRIDRIIYTIQNEREKKQLLFLERAMRAQLRRFFGMLLYLV